MKIAIDITGGDLAPKAPRDAAIKFAKDNPKVELVLLGYEQDLDMELPTNITKHFVTQTVEMCDDPRSLLEKKESAIYQGSLMLKNKEVDAFASSGSSGGLVAAGVQVVKRIGKNRPAFPIFFPNQEKGTMRMYLDVGATADAQAPHIVNYAHLGKIYAQSMLGIENPNIKLLNIGAEPSKGNTVYREAYQLLEQDENINFTGNVEGYNVLDTEADIIVMEGFVGNVLLKTLEGSFDMFKSRLKQMMLKNLKGKLSALLLKKELVQFKEDFNPHKIACAPILGIDGLMVKIHGSAKEDNYYNAYGEAVRLVENELIRKLKENEL